MAEVWGWVTLMFTPMVKFELPKHKILLLFITSLPREQLAAVDLRTLLTFRSVSS